MTMQNQSVICFASDQWDSMWRNRHQIMSRLSRTNKVLYIEPYVYSLRGGVVTLIRSLMGQNLQKERLKHLDNGIWVYRHPTWGFKSNWTVLNQLGVFLRVFAIRLVLRKLKMKSPILWVVSPRYGNRNIVKYFKKSLVIYHVVDNYSKAPYWDEETRRIVAKEERAMLSIADIVVVTSPFLLEKHSKYNSNVHLVKNAVDYEKFAPARQFKNIPEDMEHISKPIIGHIGILNDKLDYDLINTVARARPDWSFVFVGGQSPGNTETNVYKFTNGHPSNVFLLGQRNVTDIPRYIHACHICILPYRRDKYTEAIDSLKLYEYFACEKPVVATDVPTARERSQAVYIANDANDFIQKLEKAMTCDTLNQRVLQRSIAQQNTWDKRIEQLSFIIKSSLQKKSGREF